MHEVLVAQPVLPQSNWPVALTFWALFLVKKQASCRGKDRILCGWLLLLAKAPCMMPAGKIALAFSGRRSVQGRK